MESPDGRIVVPKVVNNHEEDLRWLVRPRVVRQKGQNQQTRETHPSASREDRNWRIAHESFSFSVPAGTELQAYGTRGGSGAASHLPCNMPLPRAPARINLILSRLPWGNAGGGHGAALPLEADWKEEGLADGAAAPERDRGPPKWSAYFKT